MLRWISCQGVWLPGILNPPCFAHAFWRLKYSALVIRILAVRLFRSMRIRSPVFRIARPPPVAASGDAFRIEGEPDVPDCRPSPMHGNVVMPRLISAAGGCMFTTSHEPG